MEEAFLKKTQEVSKQLETHAENGLSQAEVAQRQEKYGLNELEQAQQKSLWRILWDQINNPVIYLLATAVVLAFSFGDVEAAIAIIVVIVFNTAIGFWMEFQARQSMKALKEMETLEAHLIREGKTQTIEAQQIVPGDLISVVAGDMVPADARLVEANDFKVDESALTGESLPVEKQVEALTEKVGLGDRRNMIYKNTAVTNGNARAMVTATGMDTQIGHISKMVSEAEAEEVPLNAKLRQLTQRLIWATLGLATLFFLIGLTTGKDVYELVQTAIAWTIAAIPEGLPIVASIALARGMLRLAQKNVIIKKLAAVETLGETTVIFTDKTGTLTLNQLSVHHLEFPDQTLNIKLRDGDYKISEVDRNKGLATDLQATLEILTLCNNASLGEKETGDPLEISSLHFCRSIDSDFYNKLQKKKRYREDPFESETMRMGTIHEDSQGYLITAKGATDKILEVCSAIYQNEEEQEFPEKEKEKWREKNEQLASEGFRILALARRKIQQIPQREEFLEDLAFVGLVAFQDPPREEVKEAVQTCKDAGIQVVMVTGDHAATASNIAEKVNILADQAEGGLSGQELEKTDTEKITDVSVFSRVDPAQKLEIIEKYQKANKVVAMTGDGVNDAPALKKADIGIAMGKKGTQVAKEAADMVLKDDAFDSIVEAIRQGRIIFGNIQKFIVYQLSYHLAEILIIASVSFSIFRLPLLPLQLLFLNLLSDVFPALALGIGPGHPEVMCHRPNDQNQPIVPPSKWFNIALYGFIIAICVTGAYFYADWVWKREAIRCNNIAFFSLALAQLWHVFNMRDQEEGIFINQVTQNKFIWGALLLCLSGLALAYFVPAISQVLSFQTLNLQDAGLILISSLAPLVIIQLYKILSRK